MFGAGNISQKSLCGKKHLRRWLDVPVRFCGGLEAIDHFRRAGDVAAHAFDRFAGA